MIREEQLKFCKACTKQKFDMQQGIVCGLTNSRAEFESHCEHYEEDASLKVKVEAEQMKRDQFGSLASPGKRFANYIIDRVFYLVFCFFFGAILGVVLAVFSPSSLGVFEDDNTLVSYLLAIILGVIFYSTLEAATGRTIGKYITKTKVVDLQGNRPTYVSILKRSLCRFIPFEAFSFLGSDAVGWHDSISETRVVNI